MTETLSRTDVDRKPITSPRIEGAPDGLQIEAIDRVVGTRKQFDQDFKQQAEITDIDTYRSLRIDELLAENGITSSDDNPEANQLYELAKTQYNTASKNNEDSWRILSEESNTLRPQNVVYNDVHKYYTQLAIQKENEMFSAKLHERLDGESEFENDETEVKTTESSKSSDDEEVSSTSLTYAEKDAAVQANTEYVTEYAAKLAERSKRMIEGAKTREDIEHSKIELSDMIAAMSTELWLEMSNDGESPEAIADAVDSLVYDQSEAIIAAMEQHRIEDYQKSKPFMKKYLYDKWAQWGEEGTKGKLKKAAAFALPGAALGVFLVPIAGAVGFGAVTGGLAVTGARSIGRRFVGAKLDERNMTVAAKESAEFREQADKVRTGSAEQFNQNDILNFLSERSTEHRKRNRNRAIGGTAIALSVGLVSGTAADALVDRLDNFAFGEIGEKIKDGFNFNTPDVDAPGIDTPDINPTMPNPDGLNYDHNHDYDRDGDGVRNWLDSNPDNSDVTELRDVTPEASPNTVDWNEFNNEARWIRPSEGGFQTLKEMGIPEYKWNQVWQDAGAKLHEQGKTYMMEDGNWGWTNTMRLTNNDLTVIAKAASQNGINL